MEEELDISSGANVIQTDEYLNCDAAEQNREEGVGVDKVDMVDNVHVEGVHQDGETHDFVDK
jgi:hypothetical protein